MFGGFIPREGKFFDLFKSLAEEIVSGAKEFRDMLANLDENEKRSRTIKDIEHRGDEITHSTMDLLHKTFITPMDREDIHALVSKMDDVLDFIDAVQGKKSPSAGIHEAIDMTLPGLVSQESIRRGGAWLDVPDSRQW